MYVSAYSGPRLSCRGLSFEDSLFTEARMTPDGVMPRSYHQTYRSGAVVPYPHAILPAGSGGRGHKLGEIVTSRPGDRTIRRPGRTGHPASGCGTRHDRRRVA